MEARIHVPFRLCAVEWSQGWGTAMLALPPRVGCPRPVCPQRPNPGAASGSWSVGTRGACGAGRDDARAGRMTPGTGLWGREGRCQGREDDARHRPAGPEPRGQAGSPRGSSPAPRAARARQGAARRGFGQARAEQEEEFISNTLFKKIQALQKEKETLAVNYEKEEEFLTNELSRKLMQLQHEKAELEQHLEQEQEFQVNKLMKKIKKLENDTISKQLTLEQLRREKIDLENTLEQEQEALVNRLWKRMDKLEAEKRILQEKLDQPVSAPPSPRDISMEIDSPENMMRHIRFLKNEVERLKKQLRAAQLQHSEKMAQYLEEERHMREENLRLQRKLQREMERREALCRQLSESESSLEMDDERYFNEMSAQGLRPRTVSSPIPYTPSPSSSRPISPGLSYASHTVGFTPPTSLTRAGMSYYNSPGLHVQHMGPSHGITRPSPRRSNSPDKFKRPTPPPSPNTQTPVQPPPPPPPPPVQPTVQSAASQSATFQHSVHPSSQP
ncbi:coiled-coil domain-containing protein 6 [Athene cunicularia]|uniref:coiled-coil domain-containing protein 6 n=1 Tax=Athene cunicularia TaxID=194338 RepID=UPI000EF6FAFC|nr:coiled-coil domain-containing protein 6 [Athene cunicularia]